MKNSLESFFHVSVILALAALGYAAAPAQAEVLKVLQLNFNSEVVLEDQDERFRGPRFEMMVDWINQNSPDILMLDEGWNSHGHASVIRLLAEATGYDYTYRVVMGIPGVYADSDGILVKKKFHLEDRTSIELPQGKFSIGDGRGWVFPFGANSYAVGGRIQLADGSPLYVYSTHLITKNGAKPEDAKAIDALIREQAKDHGENPNTVRALIAGDFNSTPEDPAPQALRALGYHDTFADAHPTEASLERSCTECDLPESIYFNPMTIAPGLFPKQDESAGNERIDYVFAKGSDLKTLASTVVFTKTERSLWMSDHYGVFSTLAIGAYDPSVSYPNPLRDSPDSDQHPSLVVHLNDQNLACDSDEDQDHDDCTHFLPDAEVSASHGITFINDTKKAVKISFSGTASVLARSHDRLAAGKRTTFYFEPKGEYSFSARPAWSRKRFFGNLRASLP